jgi:hypothetical protein
LKINQAKSNSEKLEILTNELKQLNIENKKREYTQYESPNKQDSQKRRARPSSCTLKEVTPLETFKKSSSEPDELHTHRNRLEGMEEKSEGKVEKSKSSRHSASFFKKTKKTYSEELIVTDSLHQPITDKKNDVLIVNYTTSSKLPPILEFTEADSKTGKEKPDLDIKPVNNVTTKPVKHASGLFSLGRKQQSDLTILITELTCLSIVIKHRKDTEDALQRRIYPIVETESAQFTKI